MIRVKILKWKVLQLVEEISCHTPTTESNTTPGVMNQKKMDAT